MSTGFVAKLLSAGQAITGEVLRAIAGKDGSGNAAAIVATDYAGLLSGDMKLEASRGNIAGHRVYYIPGHKIGIDAAALDDITETGNLVIPNPAGVGLEIVSSSPNDAAGGTGIQSLEIHYLDDSGVEQFEVKTLDGTTPVLTTALNFTAIQYMHTKTVGSGGVAAGTITLRNIGGAGSDFEVISAGGNQSLSARFTIPAAHKGYIIGWRNEAIGKKMDFRLRATVDRFARTLLPGVFLFQDVTINEKRPGPWIKLDPPLECPALSAVKVSALADSAGGEGSCMFAIVLIAD